MFSDVNQAIAFEKQVKGWRRAKKEAVMRGDWELLPGLSKTPCNAQTLRRGHAALWFDGAHHDILFKTISPHLNQFLTNVKSVPIVNLLIAQHDRVALAATHYYYFGIWR